jgi:hypothetical protein
MVCVALASFVAAGCTEDSPPPARNDEAMSRALEEDTPVAVAANNYFYPKRIYDYFRGMDSIVVPTAETLPSPLMDLGTEEHRQKELEFQHAKPPELSDSETLGRNTWMMWCAGNEGFWDWLSTDSLGFIDLLKLIDTRERNTRFQRGGLINEPEMEQSRAPAQGDFGLWLDRPRDPRLQEWRRRYIEKTFGEITNGRHKSQIGLKGDDGSQTDLYLGDPKAFKGKGYDYPSAYVMERYQQSSADAPKGESYGKYYDEEIPPPDIYGLPTGIVGLRLFPNPYFDKAAQAAWDPERYYTDKSYYTNPRLVRPYRVGVSCAYCHASFHPLNPPLSVNDPEWQNISGSIGAQYLRIRVAFGNLLEKDQFVYHLLDSQPPGTIDTSLIASDNINNPNTMNAVFNLPQRAILSFRNPPEVLSADSAGLPSLWGHPEENPANGASDPIPGEWRKIFEDQGLGAEIAGSNSRRRRTPRILLDGSDSIGAWGALARVYLNIGSYWEQWNEVHQPVIGFTPQRAFRLRDCETHSVYWNATTLRVGGLRDYFLKVTPPMPLASAPKGRDRFVFTSEEQTKTDSPSPEAREKERARHVDVSQLAEGRRVFAQHCIVCHSSIQPESSAVTLFQPKEGETEDQKKKRTADQKVYEAKHQDLINRRQMVRNRDSVTGEFWEHEPAQWLRDSEYQKWASEIVEQPAFWKWNYLSIDYRIPVTLVGTNSARAMATNSITGHVWEDFASESYRKLPSPGPISYFDPYQTDGNGEARFTPRHKVAADVPKEGGGPGFYRVPSLVSVWATAPFLHNNSLGLFNNDPSVEGRLAAFDDAIRKLLWPAKRLESSSYNGATAERLKADHGLIWRTTEPSYLTLQARRVPYFAEKLPPVAALHRKFPWLARVFPFWLPTAVLMASALVILLVSNDSRRRIIGVLALVVSAVLATLFFLATRYPAWRGLSGLREIQPAWLLVGSVLGLAVVLLLPFSAFWRRAGGYLYVGLGLLIGGIVSLNAGQLSDLSVGPIPAGTPVNLIANFNSEADLADQAKSFNTAVAGLAEIESRHLEPHDARQVLRTQIAPALMKVNKCPDFVMDKGHDFDWFHSMTDNEKNALIELLKTF